jgi:hypothetical protein
MKKSHIDQDLIAALPQQIREAARDMALFTADPNDMIVRGPGCDWTVAPAWSDPNEFAWKAHWFPSVEAAIADWAAGVADQLGIARSL